jgi:hypothetical protein
MTPLEEGRKLPFPAMSRQVSLQAVALLARLASTAAHHVAGRTCPGATQGRPLAAVLRGSAEQLLRPRATPRGKPF